MNFLIIEGDFNMNNEKRKLPAEQCDELLCILKGRFRIWIAIKDLNGLKYKQS